MVPCEFGTALKARNPASGSTTHKIAVSGESPLEVTIGLPTPEEEDSLVEPAYVKTGAPLLLVPNL